MSADPVERLAIELRQIDAEDAAHGRDAGTRKRNWDGASEWLKNEYRKQARRLLRFIAAGSEHVYLSTGCLHGDHGYCQRVVGSWHKQPAQCKFCAAPCICHCHQAAPTEPADQLVRSDPALTGLGPATQIRSSKQHRGDAVTLPTFTHPHGWTWRNNLREPSSIHVEPSFKPELGAVFIRIDQGDANLGIWLPLEALGDFVIACRRAAVVHVDGVDHG